MVNQMQFILYSESGEIENKFNNCTPATILSNNRLTVEYLFKNTSSVLYFMNSQALFDTLEDLIENTCASSENSLEVFSLTSVHLFLTEGESKFKDEQSQTELVPNLRKWFKNLEDDQSTYKRSTLAFSNTHDTLMTRLKYYFVGTCWSPLLLLFPDVLSNMNHEFSKVVADLVKHVRSDMGRDSYQIVPLIYSLYQHIKELHFADKFSDFLSSPDVRLKMT